MKKWLRPVFCEDLVNPVELTRIGLLFDSNEIILSNLFMQSNLLNM